MKLGFHVTLLHLPLNERMSETRIKWEGKIKEAHVFTNTSNSYSGKLELK